MAMRAVDTSPFRAPSREETFEECKAFVTHALEPTPPPLRRPSWGDRRTSVCIRCGVEAEDVFDINGNRIGQRKYRRPPGWAEWNAKYKDTPMTWADWQALHMRTLRRRMREQ